MEKNVKYRGVLNLGEMPIPCYVLEDGTRVLSGRGMQEALKMVDEAEEGRQTAGTRLSRYLSQKSLKPFIYKDKEDKLSIYLPVRKSLPLNAKYLYEHLPK